MVAKWENLWVSYVRPRYKEIFKWKREDYLLNSEIAQKLGLTLRQFNEILRHNKTLSDILSEGDKYIVTQTENALFKRAQGYDIDETHYEIYPSGKFTADGQPIMLQRQKTITRHIDGSVAAQQFILHNLCPDKWKKADKTNIVIAEKAYIIDDIGEGEPNVDSTTEPDINS